MKHVRVIVTEVGAQVQVDRVLTGDTPGSVDRLTRDALRQVIQSALNQEHWPEDFGLVFNNGFWFTDSPAEDYAVLILTPQEVLHADPHTVEVRIEGGAVTSVHAPPSIQVRVIDYDVQQVDGQRVVSDSRGDSGGGGRPCVITTWGEAVTDE